MWQTIQNILQRSWQQLQDHALAVLPNLLAALFILAVAVPLAWLAGRVAGRLLRQSALDRRADQLGIAGMLERVGILSTVRLLAAVLQWGIVLVGILLAFYSLAPATAGDLVYRFLLYLPHIVVATLILAVGALLSRFLSRSVLLAAVNAELSAARFLAGLTRAAVLLVAVSIALEHLGIGRTTVLAAFSILFAGATLACALALGLGGQDLVKRWLSERFETRESPVQKSRSFQHW